MRAALIIVGVAAIVAACGRDRANTATTVAVRRADSVPAVQPARPPLSLDTIADHLVEVWPIAVAKGKQLEETRRIVELLQAELSVMSGFESATLLASGDGSSLVLVTTWRDAAAADRGDVTLAGWLRLEADTALRRRRDGTLTPRVRVRRTVGTPPTLSDGAMLQFTRYVLKSGRMYPPILAFTDSNVAMRVLQDTAAQGGALLTAADSGAVYMLLQARNATALEPGFQLGGPAPFWAPFAEREEQLLAVVAIVHRR